MKKFIGSLTIVLNFVTFTVAAGDFECRVSLDRKEIATITAADLVSAVDGHQFSYEKSIAEYKIEIYRDTKFAGSDETVYSISLNDTRKKNKVTALTAMLTYNQLTISCLDEML